MNVSAAAFATNFHGLPMLMGLLFAVALFSTIFGRRLGQEARRIFFWSSWAMSLGIVLYFWWYLRVSQSELLRFELTPNLILQSEGRFAQTVKFSSGLAFDQLSASYLIPLLLLTGFGAYLMRAPQEVGLHKEEYSSLLSWFLFFSVSAMLAPQLGAFLIGSTGTVFCSAWLLFYRSSASSIASDCSPLRVKTQLAGDFILWIVLGLCAYHLGVVDWLGIAWGRSSLELPVRVWPIAQEMPIARLLTDSARQFLQSERSASVAGIVAFCLSSWAVIRHIPLVSEDEVLRAETQPLRVVLDGGVLLLSLYLLSRFSEVLRMSPAASLFLEGSALAIASYSAYRASISTRVRALIRHLRNFQASILLCAVSLQATWATRWGLVGFLLLQLSLCLPLSSKPSDAKHETSTASKKKSITLVSHAPMTLALLTSFALPGSLFLWVYVDLISAALRPKDGGLQVAQLGRQVIEIWQQPSWWPSLMVVLIFCCLLLSSFSLARFAQRHAIASQAIVANEVRPLPRGTHRAFWCCGLVLLLLGVGWSTYFLLHQKKLVLPLLVITFSGFGALLAWLNEQFSRGTQTTNRQKLPRFRSARNRAEATHLFLKRLLNSLSDIFEFIDDVILRRLTIKVIGLVVAVSGTLLRLTQSGRVSTYGFFIAAGLLGSTFFVLGPNAGVSVQRNDQRGVYRLHFPASFGVKIDWDLNNDGIWDTPLSQNLVREVLLEVMTERTINIRIESALGIEKVQTIHLRRPYVSNPVAPYLKWKNTNQPLLRDDSESKLTGVEK